MKHLSAQEAQQRFGVEIAIKALPQNLSVQEEANLSTVLQYMRTAYSYELNKGQESVRQYCAAGNNFEAPSTFPTAHTAEEYAESHSKVLSSLQDLHIIQFDTVIAKENLVSLRYTAEGTHKGEPHSGIEPTGKHAMWTAQGIFMLNDQHKIIDWKKDWDKMRMWKGLGWVQPSEAEFA